MSDRLRDSIFKVAGGFMASKFLFVANEIRLFGSLADGPATLSELAAKTGVPTRTLRILADAMVALGLLELQEGRYRNGPSAAAYLTGRTPRDLGAMLRFWDRVSYPRWNKLEETVRTGEGAFGGWVFSSEEQRIVSEGVQALQFEAAGALPQVYDFSRHRRLLDLGGGTGSWLVAVLRQHRNLQATLFDRPPVATVARQKLSNEPVAAGVKVIAGDFFADSIPEDHDLVLLANVVHLLAPERTRELLHRTREQVRDGARLLLVDFWTDATHTQPLFTALMAGAFLVDTGVGDVYSEDEARQWLAQTGWQALERKELAGPVSVIVAEAQS
jgi:ubiquinone/menaquinone biosynthesis C-methylase UbiE